jgi:hypothetical protein
MNNSIWKVEERSSSIPYYVIVKNGITYKERGNEEKWKKRGWAQRKADKLNDAEYPYKTLKKLGIEVKYDEVHKMDYIDSDELDDILFDKGDEYTDKFNKTFGIQTMGIHGPYPSDVEAVLCRLETGKLTGSQKFWD